MLNKYVYKAYVVLILSTSLTILGCKDNTSFLSENDLKELSAYAISLNASNRDNYYPLIDSRITSSHNPELHREVLEIAMVIDTLAMYYIDGTGGIAEDGTMWNTTESGEKGNIIYRNLKVKEKLTGLLNSAKANAGPADKDLIRSTAYIVEDKFLSNTPYFNEQRLSERPLSVLSLELLLLENRLCALLLEDLSTVKEKK